jgi:hypothetical protein
LKEKKKLETYFYFVLFLFVKHQKSMKRKRETESNEQVTSCETHGLQNHDTSLITSHGNENENEQNDEVVCFLFQMFKHFFSTQFNHRFLEQTSHTQQM